MKRRQRKKPREGVVYLVWVEATCPVTWEDIHDYELATWDGRRFMDGASGMEVEDVVGWEELPRRKD